MRFAEIRRQIDDPAPARAAEPFYFHRRQAPLFGVYHAPAPGLATPAGVVLCAPLGHEYIVVHRAYREIAVRLADGGFHVLRFDYHATGDSGGDCETGTPSRWLGDISAAIGELRLRMAASTVALVGCRLGATLLTLAAAERGDIQRLVLWDPVVSGRGYLAELVRRQEEMLRRTHVTPSAAPPQSREFLGFAMTESACDEIDALDLLSIAAAPAREALILYSTGCDCAEPLAERWRSLGCGVECQQMPVRNAWTWIEDVTTVLVPVDVVTRIVDWIAIAR